MRRDCHPRFWSAASERRSHPNRSGNKVCIFSSSGATRSRSMVHGAWCMVHGASQNPTDSKPVLMRLCVCVLRAYYSRGVYPPPPPSPISFFFVGNALLSLMKLKPYQGIIKTTGNARFAYDTYRRFLNMYSDVVMDLDKEPFEEVRILHGRHLQRQVLPIFITFSSILYRRSPPPIGVNAIHRKRTSQSVVGSYDTIEPLTGIMHLSRMTPEVIPRSRCRVLVCVFVCVYVCMFVPAASTSAGILSRVSLGMET